MRRMPGMKEHEEDAGMKEHEEDARDEGT